MNLLIENKQDKLKITNEINNIVEVAINATLEYEKFEKECEIGITFVDNNEIKELNKTHRNIDKETDVLSFPLIDFINDNPKDYTFDDDYLMLGDIVISLEKAVEQANEYGHSVNREIGFLTVHSTLHLLGYDHDNDENTRIMRTKEEEILNSVNLKRE